MTISNQDQIKSNKFAVVGRLEHENERKELLETLQGLLRKDAGAVWELDFYDADTLPDDVIEALTNALDHGIKLKIVAYRPLLCHCLMRLGLPVSQVFSPLRQSILPQCRAMVIGGSAQSLDKIMYIIGNLPLGRVAVFIAQHVQEDQANLLDRLLKVRTEYSVLMPQHLTPVEAGTIYIAPPGHHMKVAHGLVYLTRDRKIQFARPSIDALFNSVAVEYGDQALAILLCGYGTDGVEGCAKLLAEGSCVLIENGDECEPARVLPDKARDAGEYWHVLKVSALASIAAAVVTEGGAQASGDLLSLFLHAINDQYGYDFSGYQRNSLERRINRLIVDFGLDNFADFQRVVLSENKMFERLLAEISVGVTAFFRHPGQFRELRQEILPYLDSFPLIRIWSAGCSTGEEAYSLAILLEEMGMLQKSWIFATDINPYLLQLAKSSLFPIEALDTSRENYLSAGGARLFDIYAKTSGHYMKINKTIRERILFYRHSLVHSGVFNEFQLIVCRNVLIYFDADLQAKVLRHFADSLHSEGFLLLGPQDGLRQIALKQGFKPYNLGEHCYRLRAGTNYG